jgi:formate hydrogenlyase subunit 4
MLELVPFATALTTAIAILSAIWIYRKTNRFDSVHFIFAIGVIVYTLFHFYACGILGIVDPLHGLVTGVFISSVAWVNAYCSSCNTGDNVVNIGVCRRKHPLSALKISKDRRQTNSHTIFKSIAKQG